MKEVKTSILIYKISLVVTISSYGLKNNILLSHFTETMLQMLYTYSDTLKGTRF